MEPRGRGRGNRGRARSAAPDSQPVALQQQMAGVRRPGGPPQGTPWGAPRPPVPEADVPLPSGRGSRRDVPSVAGTVVTRGDGNDLKDSVRGGGNGGVRGRNRPSEVLVTKPKHIASKKGTEGTRIALRANYFKLISATKWGLNQYRVDISPELDDTRIRKKLVSIGVKNLNCCTGYLFDGTVLYTPNKLHPDPLEFVTLNEVDGRNYNISIRMVSEVQWGDFNYLQLFNIIIRKCFAYMKFSLMGRNYFDPLSKVVLKEHNMELWPGYSTSMRQFEQGIMLNVDMQVKVLRLDRVIDLFMESAQSRNPTVDFQQKVIGSVVMTSYNNKTYRIDDVDFKNTPLSTFTKRDGSQITYKQYFQERYNVRIQINDQPMLVSKSKEREIRAGMPELVVLVPELCVLTGLTDKQRDNFTLMKAMGEYTRVPAGERMRKLKQFVQRLKGCPQAIEEVKRWDLQLADDLINFDGRVLPPETLVLKMNKEIYPSEEADWTKSLRVAPMFITVNVTKLAIIVPSRLANAARDFSSLLQRVGDGMSMQIGPKPFVINDDRTQTYLEELEKVINMQVQMVMVILPNNSGDRYNAIKKKCYVDRAIPCQVMVGKNLTAKGAMSIATKVAIQLNCKMGGAPWGTRMPSNTMVCGYDVCRDTANRKKSFAGMVATQDVSCTSYYSMTTEHEQEQELSKNIAAFVLMACKNYQNRNKTLPERIVIYRDGVGDGQIPSVKSFEVERIKEKLKEELYLDKPVKMAYIIVTKRINTKFFRDTAIVASRGVQDFNPPPGTVIDDVVTLPERYDFFLVPQCVRQGTVSPTSFNIIEDTLGIDANKIQRFTYKMCHMYFNWSGTVRVPAPCQYAHKLAFLTAQSLHRPANQQLANTLYYL